MVLTTTLTKLLKQKKPDKLLLTEISMKINQHLPDDQRVDLQNLPDPLVVLSKVVTLPDDKQQEIIAFLELMLQADEEAAKKKASNQRTKMIMIALGVGVAFIAIVLDPKLLTEEFLNALMQLFIDLSKETTE